MIFNNMCKIKVKGWHCTDFIGTSRNKNMYNCIKIFGEKCLKFDFLETQVCDSIFRHYKHLETSGIVLIMAYSFEKVGCYY